MGINKHKFPYRALFGSKQLSALKKVFYRSWKNQQDFGYNGYFEKIYTRKFIKLLGKKGYADAVNSGTSALYAILKSLKKKQKKKIAYISPVTNPGSITPLAILGYTLQPIDSDNNSFNICLNELENKSHSRTLP